MAHKRSVGLLLDPEVISVPPPEPAEPPPAREVIFGWGIAYKVGSDILAGETITVDFSGIDGVTGLAAAVQEFKGLDFGSGGPSGTPWEDPPFNGSMASSGTVDASRNFHVTLDVIDGHDFRAAGWKGMQVASKRYPNAIDWAGQDPWVGTEYHADGGLGGEGGLDLNSHLGWMFVDQPSGITDINPYIELVNTTTGEDYCFGLCDILTTGTVEVNPGFDFEVSYEFNKVDVILDHNIIAPSGLVIMTAMIVDTSIWPDTDAGRWPVVSDSTHSSDNFAKGRVLTSCTFAP